MNYTRHIELDINAMSNSTIVAVKQGDAKTRFIKIKLLRDGEQFIPDSGTIAIFRCEKPDGKAIVDTARIENDGTLTVELTAQAIAVVGRSVADICLIKDGETLSTITFIINVVYSPDVSNRAASSDEFRALTDLLSQVGEQIEGTPGGYYLPNVSESGELSWTPSQSNMPHIESKNISGPRGADGRDGTDGTSVSISSISESSDPGSASVVTFSDGSTLTIYNGVNGINGTNGTSVSIVDVQDSSEPGGTSVVKFSNGVVLNIKNGLNGTAGTNGIDGSSVSITKITESTDDGGSNIIEFSDGSVLTIKNGHSGSSGLPITVTEITESEEPGGINTISFSDGNTFQIRNGINGTNGTNGSNGESIVVSNVIESSEAGGVNTIEFSDGSSITIKNGLDGSNGSNGDKGDTGAVFTPSVSANGVISWTNDGGLDNPSSIDLVAAVIAALPNGDEVSY